MIAFGRHLGAVALAACIATGCAAQPALHSDLKEPELRNRLDADFPPGMTVDQVQTKLDEERVPKHRRRLYPCPPEQLLARLAPATGFWVHEPEFEDIRYVDAWFVFGTDGRLVRVDTENKRMRVQAHQYIDPPFQTPELLPTQPRAVTPAMGGGHAE